MAKSEQALNELLTAGRANACFGCEKQPIANANFGRVKLVCPLYEAHDKRTTQKCHKGMLFSYFHCEYDALNDWNSSQESDQGE